MRMATLSTLAAIAFLFVMVPASLAEPAATPVCEPATVAAQSAAPTPFSPALEPPQGAQKDRMIDGPSAQATCDAQCHDGSTVWCWGSSCSAEDSNCSAGIRGSCWGTDTGTRYCPKCPSTCEPGASCTSNDDCGGYTCDKEPWEIVGTCVCSW